MQGMDLLITTAGGEKAPQTASWNRGVRRLRQGVARWLQCPSWGIFPHPALLKMSALILESRSRLNTSQAAGSRHVQPFEVNRKTQFNKI